MAKTTKIMLTNEEIKALTNIEEAIKDYREGLIREADLRDIIEKEASKIRSVELHKCESCGYLVPETELYTVQIDEPGNYKKLCEECLDDLKEKLWD